MKVFVDANYDEYGFDLIPIEAARKGAWIRQHGTVYDLPKRLVRKYEAAKAECERMREEINAITEEQKGEPSPYRLEDNRPKPKVTTSVFQLRHVKTRAVMVELSVPVAKAVEWLPQPGQEPDGECQWWASIPDEDGVVRRDFVKVGGTVRYDQKKQPAATVFDPRNYDDNPHPD